MRARDRLHELRRRAGLSSDPVETPSPAAEHPPGLQGVLDQVERVQSWVEAVRRDNTAARALLADTAYHTDTRLQERLDAIVTNCNALGLKVCGALRQLESAADDTASVGTAEARVARVQAAVTRVAYCRALDEHHALLDAARRSQIQLLQHHAHIMNLPMSDEECQSLLDSENIALFVDNLQMETRSARLALREAECRRAELARVEGALRDVHALFVQIASLVHAQQDAIDTVEHYALQATHCVNDGQVQLLKGSVARTKTRKKKWSLIICIASFFILVLLLLIIT